MDTLVWHYLVTLDRACLVAAPMHADRRANTALIGRALRRHINKEILKYGGIELFMRALGKLAAAYPKIVEESAVHAKTIS